VGHYTQGYNTQYVNNRVVVIDENGFNHYVNEIKNPVEEADEFLDTLAESPLNRIPFKPDPEEIERTLEILEDEGLDPADHRDSVGEFHAKAPGFPHAGQNLEECGFTVKYRLGDSVLEYLVRRPLLSWSIKQYFGVESATRGANTA